MDGLPLPRRQRRDKRFLRDAHIAVFAHPCLALFLLFQQLFLTADVAACAFTRCLPVTRRRGCGRVCHRALPQSPCPSELPFFARARLPVASQPLNRAKEGFLLVKGRLCS